MMHKLMSLYYNVARLTCFGLFHQETAIRLQVPLTFPTASWCWRTVSRSALLTARTPASSASSLTERSSDRSRARCSRRNCLRLLTLRRQVSTSFYLCTTKVKRFEEKQSINDRHSYIKWGRGNLRYQHWTSAYRKVLP